MGWKGTLRSINSAVKAAERENQRRYKAEQKEQIARESSMAVDDWKQYIHELITIHTDLADSIDWQKIATLQAPTKPAESKKHRTELAPKLRNFKPKSFDFLFGGTEKRKQKLIKKFEEARTKDQRDYKQALKNFEAATKEWQEDTLMAVNLLSGDAMAAKEIIATMQTISEEPLIGQEIQFQIYENLIHAIVKVHTDEIVPNYRLKQLASGKLSETKMPIGEFNELYQDYVSSAALKIAGDIFHILPNEEIYVTCIATMLDTQTGHLKPTPILSVKFIRSTLKQLNLAAIDPSDSLRNFIHNMKFKRATGLAQIVPLKELETSPE